MSANRLQTIVLVTSVIALLSACTPQSFEAVTSAGPGKTDVVDPITKKVTEVFTQDENANKVDILIINDTSMSMEVEQTKMSERFPSFVSALGDLNYQISMTTTDIDSTDSKNTYGRGVNWTGTTSKILTPKTASASSVFKNTIRRAETVGCTVRGDCPSGNEQPLRAAMLALDQRFTANAGLFRDNVDLAVVVLSDEDEMSNGPATATKPNDVIERFKAYYGDTKRLRTFGIVVQSGDEACRLEQLKQTSGGNGAFFGTHVEELARLTGGSTNSICDADYSKSLTDISKSVRRLVGTFELTDLPKSGTVKVTLTPVPTTPLTWKIEGKSLIFDTPPAAGTRVEIAYEP